MTPYELGQATALLKLGMRGVAGRVIEESPQMLESFMARGIPAKLSRSATEAGKQTTKKLTEKELANLPPSLPGLNFPS